MNSQYLEILTNIIGAVESGGQIYGKRRYEAYAGAYANTPKEVTCTLGWAQNYGNEGRKLCRMILEENPTEFRSVDTANIEAKLKKDWVATKWSPNSAEKTALINIITTPTGKKCQDKLFEELMTKYEAKAIEYGIPETNIPALFMWCEIEHLGGLNPTKRIFNRCGKNPTVDAVFNALMQDQNDTSSNNQVGDKKFQSRHECCVKWIKQYVTGTITKKEETAMGYDVQKLIDVARAEIGYLEKSSDYNLDSKTGNAGSNNYTKYWRDLKPSWNGSFWCDCFVSWCFYKAYGKTAANTLLCGGLNSFDCDESASYYKKKKQWYKSPKVGDQIFFGTSSDYKHTGIVVRVEGSKVYTIEGNTSGASGVIRNGGGVCEKSYSVNESRIMGYGRPNYGTQTTTPATTQTKSGELNQTEQWVGKVTTALNVRTGAGVEYPTSKIYPLLETGNLVSVCDTVTNKRGEKWYYIKISNDIVKARAGKPGIYDFVKADFITRA